MPIFNDDTQLGKILNAGERLHFLYDGLGKFIIQLMGGKPDEGGPVTSKAVSYFFGLGTEEERRLENMLRKIREKDEWKTTAGASGTNYQTSKKFLDFCEYLFAHDENSLSERIEMTFVRNAYFVYIARQDDATEDGKKRGEQTSKTTWESTTADPDVKGGSKKHEETAKVDIMTDGSVSNGILHIREVVQDIVDAYESLPTSEPEGVRWKQAYDKVQKSLYIRGVPCRKVGDADFTGWVARTLGISKENFAKLDVILKRRKRKAQTKFNRNQREREQLTGVNKFIRKALRFGF